VQGTTLHFKACIVVEESFGEQDKNAMNDLMKMIDEATAMIDLDEPFCTGLPNDEDEEQIHTEDQSTSATSSDFRPAKHVHKTPKQEIPTR